MLHIIGIGLADQSDISLKGLELIRTCSKVYLETYTSLLQCPLEDLEKLYGKKIILADRALVEQSEEILTAAQTEEVAFLVIGDPLSATTHHTLVMDARKKSILGQIVHNASVLTAVGETGLQLYKFGKVTSIPFENKDVIAPVDLYWKNKEMGLHTLFLLDLRPDEEKYLSVQDAIVYLISHAVPVDTFAVACARVGAVDGIIKVGSLQELQQQEYGNPPYCLIIPGKMHFMEEEALEISKL